MNKLPLYLIILTLSVYGMMSCINKSISEESRIINKWKGREIKFASNMTDAITGDPISIDDADFMLLTYVDSAGCASCKMKLNFWKELMSYMDTLDNQVKFLMVIHPDDEKAVKYLLTADNFDYPVFLDKNDSFNIENGFPTQNIFQSFLLDKSHRVLAIGNPTYNPKIEELYKSIISGRRFLSSNSTIDISISQQKLSFRDIEIGDTLQCEFVIENHGKESIKINKILSSCDCTTATAGSDIIEPNQSINVSVVFFVEDVDVESFNRIIQVYLCDHDTPIQFVIEGNIVE